MIVYRNTDVDVPFLWASDAQPSGRWHGDGEGPVQYVSTSPDAAWCEFLRHAGITDPGDVDGVERTMWSLEIDDAEAVAAPDIDLAIMTGDRTSYADCQAEARRLRAVGATRLIAPCAAKDAGSPSGWLSDPDLRRGPPAPDATIVLIGPRPTIVGQMSAVGRPDPGLLSSVRHF
jgi:hypothetical protein